MCTLLTHKTHTSILFATRIVLVRCIDSKYPQQPARKRVSRNLEVVHRVGTSTTHSEYMILGVEATKTTLFVKKLLTEMGFPQHIGGPTPMQGDNWPATTLIPGQRLTKRNRFVVTDYHFANEAFELG